jgi:hypothetical protein
LRIRKKKKLRLAKQAIQTTIVDLLESELSGVKIPLTKSLLRKKAF